MLLSLSITRAAVNSSLTSATLKYWPLGFFFVRNSAALSGQPAILHSAPMASMSPRGRILNGSPATAAIPARGAAPSGFLASLFAPSPQAWQYSAPFRNSAPQAWQNLPDASPSALVPQAW